jgi:hypothetical protein
MSSTGSTQNPFHSHLHPCQQSIKTLVPLLMQTLFVFFILPNNKPRLLPPPPPTIFLSPLPLSFLLAIAVLAVVAPSPFYLDHPMPMPLLLFLEILLDRNLPPLPLLSSLLLITLYANLRALSTTKANQARQIVECQGHPDSHFIIFWVSTATSSSLQVRKPHCSSILNKIKILDTSPASHHKIAKRCKKDSL